MKAARRCLRHVNTKIGFFRLILIVERQLNAYKGFFFYLILAVLDQ